MAAKKDSKSTFEREYTIPLRKSFRNTVAHKKTPRAVRTITDFLLRHTKAKEIKLGMHLNEFMWKNGIKNPPPKVKVKVYVKDGVAKAELLGKEFKGAVVPVKKAKPQNLKEKIEAKLGANEPVETTATEVKAEEPKKETPKTETKATDKPKKKAPAKKQ